MQNLFNSVKMTSLQTNMFDLTHDVKLTLDMGKLVPILAMECIPGDRHKISCESLLRFSPLISPVMHRYDVTMHYFFVPNRILWPNWEKFITNTKLQTTFALPVPPFITMEADNSNHEIGSLADYLGVPYNLDTTNNTTNTNVSALPFAAYQAVYHEYYRDQNLIPDTMDDKPYQVADGDNTGNPYLTELRIRAWEHDYFTACLPFAQKGESVQIPMGEIVYKNPDDYQGSPKWRDTVTGNLDTGGTIVSNSGIVESQHPSPGLSEPVFYDPDGTLEVQSSNINDLRRAFKLQEWLEKAARGGSRYIEWIKVMFGVTSSDKRLQRPEYITGTKSPVVISEVLNTTGTDDAPQGNMSGHAVSVNSGEYDGSYYCEEHGWIIGIMSVMPKPAYMQGIHRSFTKLTDPTQYYFSSFANIGEQEVLNKEIYAYKDNEATFGYIPRYAEYRYLENRVCGNFRTDLSFWHHARIFANAPQLNDEFVQCTPDKRIFAVEDPNVNSLYAQVLNKIQSIRPIPKYGTPTF